MKRVIASKGEDAARVSHVLADAKKYPPSVGEAPKSLEKLRKEAFEALAKYQRAADLKYSSQSAVGYAASRRSESRQK